MSSRNTYYVNFLGSMQENGLRYKSEIEWNLGMLIKWISYPLLSEGLISEP